MVYWNLSASTNTWYSDINETATGLTYSMSLYNKLLKTTQIFNIFDASSTINKNIFSVNITHNSGLTSTGATPTLFLDNWDGYNDYIITLNNTEVDRGFVYIIYDTLTYPTYSGYTANIAITYNKN